MEIDKRQGARVVVSAASEAEAIEKAAAMIGGVKWHTGITFNAGDSLNVNLPLEDHAAWQEHWKRD